MGDYYIGLISGTSMDGIDAALVRFGESSLEVMQTYQHDYPPAIRQQLAVAMLDPTIRSVNDVTSLHREIGECFRDAANVLLEKTGISATEVAAIGSHGQTVRHEPDADQPFSLQIGDPNIIATGTGVTTIADFRSADIALGGQGAPLAPAFHEWLFGRSGASRVIVNIGGISNLTVLSAAAETTGFDTGPGNTLLDAWIRQHRGKAFDQDGAWAAMGELDEALLSRLLADDYFSMAPPKSTGFEYFNLEWLGGFGVDHYEPIDVQTTLCQLTATSIADALETAAANVNDVLICGGGVHNLELMRRLRAALPKASVDSTETAGLDPDWVEAVAFAWLAMRSLQALPGNLPSVTGANHATVLGTTHQPR
jgi:anhydro-N-acetylmuramic acid kinase